MVPNTKEKKPPHCGEGSVREEMKLQEEKVAKSVTEIEVAKVEDKPTDPGKKSRCS